jgi:hypothetical protein
MALEIPHFALMLKKYQAILKKTYHSIIVPTLWLFNIAMGNDP